jgi:hypothetical protein
MAGKKPDPTKDPDFQRVVQTFLNTPPKPHKPGKHEATLKPAKKGEPRKPAKTIKPGE